MTRPSKPAPLPKWIENEWRSRSLIENIEHPDWRLFQSLKIAWDTLDIQSKDRHYRVGRDVARKAMRKIRGLGK